MNLSDILSNSRVFVDANIVLYALQHRSRQCRSFLERCAAGSIEGYISTIVLAEIAHRRMMQEAQQRGVVGSNPSRSLSEKPELVRQLSLYAEDVRDLLDGGLVVETVQSEDFLIALELQEQNGLLTNDALNLAVTKRLGIREIATADKIFDSVQGIIVYKPGDLIH
jgi:predicted nucleic acid-binding protein